MKNNNENSKLTFKDIITNKQYRAILYLGVYFIIFLVLIVMVRVGSSDNKNRTIDKENNVITEGFNSIKNENFNFKYTLTVGEKTYSYVGKQFNEKLLFDFDNITYYSKEDVWTMKEDNKFVITESPAKYFNFFNVELIEKIIDKSILNEDEYLINLKDFASIIEFKYDKIEEKQMPIKLTKPNNIITKVEIDLTEFSKVYDNTNNDSVKLLLEYSDFGLIEDFDIK